jgi:hypothetical protein
MEKVDLRNYGDEELSLQVMNDYHLYQIFISAVYMEKFQYIKDEIDEFFEYTEEQLQDLEDTFDNEKDE